MVTSEIYQKFEHDDENGKLSHSDCHRGQLFDAKKVTFTIKPPKSIKRGPKFTKTNVDGGETSGYSLTFVGDAFAHFMYMLDKNGDAARDLGLKAFHEEWTDKLKVAQKEIARIRAKEKNKNQLNRDEKASIPRLENEIEKAEKMIQQNGEKTLALYQAFCGSYKQSFLTLVKEILETDVEYTVKVFKAVRSRVLKDDPTILVDDDDSSVDSTYSTQSGEIVRYVEREVEVTEVGERGLSYDNVLEVIELHKFHVGGYGRAEAQRSYISTHAKFPTNFMLGVKTFAQLLNDINDTIPLLSSFRHDPEMKNKPAIHAPDYDLDKKHCELALCKILRNSMPAAVQKRLDEKFPTKKLWFDYEDLTKELESVVSAIKRERDEQKKAKGASSQKPDKSGNNHNRNGKGGKPPVDKPCRMCTEAGKGAAKNHVTADCQTFNRDGTPKRGPRRQTHAHSHKDDDEDDLIEQLRRENKELKRDVRDIKHLLKGSKSRKEVRATGKRRERCFSSDSDESMESRSSSHRRL